MTDDSADFATRVADAVRSQYVGRDPYDDKTVVERVWSEPGNLVLAVYRVPYIDHPLGLRIRVYSHLPFGEEVARICEDHLGEPIGTYYDTLTYDSDGVGWWTGEPLEYFYV